MNLTTNKISFLRDVSKDISIDSNSGWRYRFLDFSLYEINTFIKLIEDDKIYMIIPQFAASKSLFKPRLNLSEEFLINNKSNPMLITQFIFEQWNNSGFELNQGTKLSFCFKFKRVWFSYK